MNTQMNWESAQNGDIKARNEIFLQYQSLVESCASNIAAGLPRHVDRDDLISNGQFGLLDAIDRFDPERGFRFETFAAPRIKGAILDTLRVQDWVPRSVRTRERAIDNATEDLTQDLGRKPSIDELSEFTSLSDRQIYSSRASSVRGQTLNIDASVTGLEGDDITIGDTLTTGVSDMSALFNTVDGQEVAKIIETLDERERATLALHYYLGMTFSQIGELFGVTESRVCQIHTRSLRQIRLGLDEREFAGRV